MALIELREVTKRYRVGEQEIVALDGIDLDIAQGEYAAIIGPSGSGKSTLMHLLGCLDTPTTGRMMIDGIDASRAGGNRLSELRNAKIGFVFQSFNLLPKFNVLQNVELPMIYAGIGGAERKRRALAAIERVGLSNRVKNTPLQLSGGQMQRVAIARALVNEPYVLIADEPTGNLDDRATRGIFQLLREINASGTAVVMATHNLELIRRSDYRTIEINRGAIVFDSGEARAAQQEEIS